jgi:hypothetical protein
MNDLLRTFALVLVWAWLPTALGAQVIDRVMARVGGQVITLSDVRAAMTLGFVRPSSGGDPTADALNVLIDRELMLAEATRFAAPEPDPAAVDARIAELRRRFASEAEWNAALEVSAMTPERLRDIVRDNLRVEAYVDQLFSAPAQPTDDEVARYYEQHRADFVRDGRQLSLDESRDLARERATAERRRALVADWVAGLRSRTVVVNLYRPDR